MTGRTYKMMGLALIVSFSLWVKFGDLALEHSQGPEGLIGRSCPDVLALTIDPTSRSSAPQIDEHPTVKVHVITFWASWCEACHAELLDAQRFLGTQPTEDLSVCLVSIDSELADVIRAAPVKAKAMMVRWDALGQAKQAFRIRVVPTTFIVIDGVVTDVKEGGGRAFGEKLKRVNRQHSRSESTPLP